MKSFLLLFISIFYFTAFTMCTSDFDNSKTFVLTKLGGILGSLKKSYSGRHFKAYEGIPYAFPPVGERRFQVNNHMV